MRRVFIAVWLVSIPGSLVTSCLSFGDLTGGAGADASADATPSDVTTSDTSTGDDAGANDATTDAPQSVLSCNADGLVAYWPMNEGSGTTVHDCHQGLDGTFVLDGGAPFWGTRSDGGNIEFNGAGYVSLGMPSQLQVNGAFTLAGWVRTEEPNATNFVSMFWNYDATLRRGYELTLSNQHTLYAQLGFGGTSVEADFPTPAQGVWMHLAVVLTPSVDLRSYLNGVLYQIITTSGDSGPFPTSGVSPDDHAAVMGPVPAQSGAWLGGVDEIRLFSRALSAAEVAELAKQ